MGKRRWRWCPLEAPRGRRRRWEVPGASAAGDGRGWSERGSGGGAGEDAGSRSRGVTEGIQSGARAGPRRETGGRGGRARVPAQAAGVAAGTADDGGGASPDVASGVIAAAAPSHALELRRERPRASAAATHRTVSARAFAAVAVLSREGEGIMGRGWSACGSTALVK